MPQLKIFYGLNYSIYKACVSSITLTNHIDDAPQSCWTNRD